VVIKSPALQEFKEYFDDIFIELEDKGMSYKLSHEFHNETIFLLTKRNINIDVSFGYTNDFLKSIDENYSSNNHYTQSNKRFFNFMKDIHESIPYLRDRLTRQYGGKNIKLHFNKSNSYMASIDVEISEIVRSSPMSN
jgi:hypothetical protein